MASNNSTNDDEDPFNPFANAAMAAVIDSNTTSVASTSTTSASTSTTAAAASNPPDSFHAKYDVPDTGTLPPSAVLEFENFDLEADKGKYSLDDSRRNTRQKEGQNVSHPIYTLEYYMKFFNVDTVDVGNRMLRSIMFWKGDFVEFLETNGDLYGPFWIATTVVFVLFVTANLASSIEAAQRDEAASADFGKLSVAASIIYSYVFLIPFLLWLAFYYYKMPMTLLELVCSYGYSLSIYIPISIICVVPLDVVKWSLSGLALFLSGGFLAHTIFGALKAKDKKSAFLAALLVFIGQTGLTLVFKLVFFSYYYK